ncbi:VRR-NUC domain-containing protein [Halodesulfovibrio sp.]|uniref:VRR-NUC domain-containing protein n=1 Tax=Halodesulfovibrio sp. TaxID=1912772 RepID=UPI0025CFCAD7|nr:VRR-NUC domain-containing protein [Halodesulfovibrio sp.]MCT4627950.1 VRR-NUC domain-containing protein [Halodesulfovibrio sp.]
MRRAAKTDSNHAQIRDALRAVGASVHDMSSAGAGFPDLAVGFKKKTFLLEVKTKTGRLTKPQVKWHDEWRGHHAIVRTEEEALKEIGAIR